MLKLNINIKANIYSQTTYIYKEYINITVGEGDLEIDLVEWWNLNN